MYFRRLYRTTGRYLPPARLVTLARTGFADPPEGQEREVSILLVDLIGFTSFSNEPNRTASEVVRVANRYFTAMQAAIDRHEGCSDKFLGDAVLAFWNGLSDEPAHALKALAAARDIIHTLQQSGATRTSIGWARAPWSAPAGSTWAISAPSSAATSPSSGPAVNETFRLEKMPDLYGLPLLVAASTAALIEAARGCGGGGGGPGRTICSCGWTISSSRASPPRNPSTRWCRAMIPGSRRSRPGVPPSTGAIWQKVSRSWRQVNSGMLRQAAKVVSAHRQPVPAVQAPRHARLRTSADSCDSMPHTASQKACAR